MNIAVCILTYHMNHSFKKKRCSWFKELLPAWLLQLHTRVSSVSTNTSIWKHYVSSSVYKLIVDHCSYKMLEACFQASQILVSSFPKTWCYLCSLAAIFCLLQKEGWSSFSREKTALTCFWALVDTTSDIFLYSDSSFLTRTVTQIVQISMVQLFFTVLLILATSTYSQVLDWWVRMQSVMFGWRKVHSSSLCWHKRRHEYCEIPYCREALWLNVQGFQNEYTSSHDSSSWPHWSSEVPHSWDVL